MRGSTVSLSDETSPMGDVHDAWWREQRDLTASVATCDGRSLRTHGRRNAAVTHDVAAPERWPQAVV
jgi:hypothetical protein